MLEEKKLLFGRLIRMNDERQVKEVWEARSIGRNSRGRLRRTWNSAIENILKEKEETWSSDKEIARNLNTLGFKRIVLSYAMN